MAPGSITATCTPLPSWSISSRKPAAAADRANLVIEYGIKNGMGKRPAIELTNSTVPRWRAIMPRSASCVSARVANTLISNTRRMRSMSTSANEPDSPMPALLSSTSTGQSSTWARSRASVMSSLCTSNTTLRRAASARNSSACARLKVVANTRWPRAARAKAASRPMPVPAPVIRMVFFMGRAFWSGTGAGQERKARV